MIGALLEVRSYTIPQIDCFTDVEDNAILVLMKIASGLCREILQLFSQCQRVINIIHPGLFYLGTRYVIVSSDEITGYPHGRHGSVLA
jgi:hypothetical protein